MADYKELIRRAIQALPENNGAARRAVYEKARAALVGQLRGLNPPLPARDITQHRLQLEDCIRQVEQEASEAVIAGLKQSENLLPSPPPSLPPPTARPTASAAPPRPAAQRPAPTPPSRQAAPVAAARPAAASSAPAPTPRASAPRASTGNAAARVAPIQPQAASVAAAAPLPLPRANGQARPATRPQPAPPPPPPEDVYEDEPDTIAELIAAAEEEPIEVYDDHVEPSDEAESVDESVDQPAPMFTIEPRQARRAPAPVAATPAAIAAPQRSDSRAETRSLPAIVARAEAAKAGKSIRPAENGRRANGHDAALEEARPAGRQSQLRQPQAPIALGRNGQALSTVREVEVEPAGDADPQVAIERAIAALEREARGEESDSLDGAAPMPAAKSGRARGAIDNGLREPANTSEAVFARAPVENERGGSAVTIFLLVFLLLLVGAGGGGFWAWREGYIDFDAMFGKTPAASSQTRPQAAVTPAPQVADQGNTAAASAAPVAANQQMAPAPAAQPTTAATPVVVATDVPAPPAAEPSAQSGEAPKSEERLTQSTAAATAPAAADVAKPAAPGAAPAGGSQSLLLEASQDGTTGAVPFSGTVEWSKGTDELGQPTLIGKANIPARNLGVSVLIRKNSDPTLPASHLMEINFSVTDSFIGGAISGLPGVLLKNEELVQGTPLVGASARVVGNSFLFALSSSAADTATNKDLLTSRKWIDLAIIYATGKKAIITLEKDDKAEGLFNDVFGAWAKEAPAAAAAPAPAPAAAN